MKVINPWTKETEELPGKVVYQIGEYKIVKRYDKFFDHLRNNVIITQMGGINKKLVDDLHNKIIPEDESDRYHFYERPMDAYKRGMALK